MRRAPTLRYRTVARSARLFRYFLVEDIDPEGIYTDVAGDTNALIERHEPLLVRFALDIGAGQEQSGRRFVDKGARHPAVDLERKSLHHGVDSGAVVGLGERLPLPEGFAYAS